MEEWFPRPKKPDPTYGRPGERTVSWLRRSTLPLANECHEFLNRNLSALPEDCRQGIFRHVRHEQHYRDGFFELVVARTLQELGANIECEPENPRDRTKVDFVATFPDGAVYVEAVSPLLDRELGAISSREAPLRKLVEENVPPGWAAHIGALPNVGPDQPRRHIKAFLQREMGLPPPTNDDEEVEIRESFEHGDIRITLFPQSRYDLSADTKIATYVAIGYVPNNQAVLRSAVKRKYKQLSNLDGTSLVALNMFSTTSRREDLDRALFGTSVTQFDEHRNEVGRYFKKDGLFFVGGEGKPTISGVLAFPEVGFLRCEDPVLWVHPRFEGKFPRALYDLETRYAPGAEMEVSVKQAKKTDLLKNLGFVENR